MTSSSKLDLALTRDPDELVRLFYSLDTVADIAELLEVPWRYLVYILYRSDQRSNYRMFDVAKKAGGARRISAPPRSLKILQSKLNCILQHVYSAKPSAHGFIRGRSILSNARRHAGKRFVLNIDLEDFFPSINFGRVRGMFMARPYELHERAATVLAQMCCYDNCLPQGAPSSPIVSNMICARLDSHLQALARKYGCDYTRYADDLTFSTRSPQFPEALAVYEGDRPGGDITLGQELASVIESNGFRNNRKKQRLQIRGGRQEVTGLIVNEFPNIKRRYVRQLRAMLHAWQKYGEENAEREFRAKYDRRSRNPNWEQPSFRRVVKGRLDFLKMVKGEGDPTYRRLVNKLNRLAPDLIDYLPEPPTDPNSPWSHWAEQYRELVFHLEVRKENGDRAAGTAFAWQRKALVTAAHCLAGEVRVSPPCPDEPIPPGSFAFHPMGREKVDLAVLSLPEGAQPFHREIPVRTERLVHAEEVAALGYPSLLLRDPGLGLYCGVVESQMPYPGGEVDTIQVTIDVAGGMSGAPVIDRRGELVGVVMETTAEGTAEGVPKRPFHHVLPVRYLLEIDFGRSSPSAPAPR